MKMCIQFLSLFIFSFMSYSQQSVEQVVQENLDFYNKRNIDGFMSSFSEEIKIFSLGKTEPNFVGKQEVRKIYTRLFKNSPSLHSNILKRIVIGNKVIDHESITGRNGNRDVLELVLIYEVSEEKIYRITVIRK